MKDSKLSESSNKAGNKVLVYKIIATIKHLKIQSSSIQKTQIVWKRHHQKSQTKLTNHSHAFSTFNEPLELLIDLQYDGQKEQYESKTTQLVAVIFVNGKEKSGGYAKIDVGERLNHRQAEENQIVCEQLTGCPDPQGYIEFQLSFEFQSEGTIDEMSMWNASSRDFNMSKADISGDQTQETKDFQMMAQKMKSLSKKIRESKENSNQSGLLNQQKIEIIQGQNKQLRLTIKDLQTKLEQKEATWKKQKFQSEKQIASLEKAVEKKSKQLNQKTKQLLLAIPENRISNTEYEDKLKDLRKDSFDEQNEKNPFQSSAFGVKSSILFEQKISGLEKQKDELEVKVSEMSIKIANLFNAALEIGGPQLLDRLQQSMNQ